VDAKHTIITNFFKKKEFFLLKGKEETQPAKKRTIVFNVSISKKLSVKDSFKKEDVLNKEFLEELGLLIIKNNLLIQFVESIWLKRLILRLCPKLNFPSKRQFS
jgi:hypothetical protein